MRIFKIEQEKKFEPFALQIDSAQELSTLLGALYNTSHDDLRFNIKEMKEINGSIVDGDYAFLCILYNELMKYM